MSASSHTTNGFFPPNSNETVASLLPAASAIERPTPVEPVKLMTATLGSSTKDEPAGCPFPWMTLKTPSGKPATWTSFAKRFAISGASSAAFITTVFPQIRAGKTFHAMFAMGVFAGTIKPAIPLGCRTVKLCFPGIAEVSVLP